MKYIQFVSLDSKLTSGQIISHFHNDSERTTEAAAVTTTHDDDNER